MRLILLVLCVFVHFLAWGQCNVSTTVNWVNGTTPSCQSNNVLQILSGGVLNFDDNADEYGVENTSIIYVSGTLNLVGNGPIRATIVVLNGGRVNINSNFDLYGSLEIKTGGTVEINDQLNILASGTCNSTTRNFEIEPGAQLLMNSSGSSDRLNICGIRVFQSGTAGSCNTFPTGGPTFCSGNAPFSGGAITPQNSTPLVLVPTGVAPIKLLYFTATLNEGAVLLKWATEKEEAFDHFEIERASDGSEFSKIAEVAGAGNNTAFRQDYSWVDENPLIGHNYYRLKAVDLNGTIEIFNVVFITTSGGKEFSVFPNPSNGKDLKFRINFDAASGDKIILLDNLGKEIQNGSISGTDGNLPLSGELKPGIYLVKYLSPSFDEVVKIVVR